jgi:Trk-type K+ transport system membrane component
MSLLDANMVCRTLVNFIQQLIESDPLPKFSLPNNHHGHDDPCRQHSVPPLVALPPITANRSSYPLFLRLILWTMLKTLTLIYPSPEHYADYKATLRFVLKYPRRVYTNLFPSAPTWWLLFMLIVLNGIDWAAFGIINIGNSAVNAIPTKYRVLDGLFQALAVRSGGFYIISIPSLRIGLQVLYVIMMYISVYPVVITMRHSNVYEERSLGIYADDDSSHDVEAGPKIGSVATKLRRTLTRQFTVPFPSSSTAAGKDAAAQHFVRQQIHGQLAHDLWWLFLAILFISIIEVSNFDRDPVTYSVFNIAFEVVSGYGCVGISTGLPNVAYSFSGGWHVLSKLILCAVMLRGRHRGLPVALDRAVRLPGRGGGELGEEEEEDRVVRSRSRSIGLREREE